MQSIVIIIILALIVLVTIRLLHRYQEKEMKDSADRSTPLQPMAVDFPDEDDGKEPGSSSSSWQQQVKTLRDEGEYEQALIQSRQHLPKIQGFRQTMLTLRADIRERLRDNLDVTSLLTSLYHTAVLGDLFRPGNVSAANVDLDLLFRLADSNLEFSYARTGYRQLALLTKTDIRHFVQAWGEPENHEHAETVLGHHWQQLLSQSANRP